MPSSLGICIFRNFVSQVPLFIHFDSLPWFFCCFASCSSTLFKAAATESGLSEMESMPHSHQKSREIRMVAGSLAANADLGASGPAAADDFRDGMLDRLILLVEKLAQTPPSPGPLPGSIGSSRWNRWKNRRSAWRIPRPG